MANPGALNGSPLPRAARADECFPRRIDSVRQLTRNSHEYHQRTPGAAPRPLVDGLKNPSCVASSFRLTTLEDEHAEFAGHFRGDQFADVGHQFVGRCGGVA